MKTQGSFNYKVNGENKTKDEIDNMDLSNMNCTVDGLSVSYSFPAEKDIKNREKLVQKCIDMIAKEHGWLFAYGDSIDFPKETVRTKTDDNKGGVLKGEEFPYDFTNKDFVEKDDVITSSNRVEKEMVGYFNKLNVMTGECSRPDDFSVGNKESQTVEKAPVFTYCKQMKNAIEALALRSLYGHKKYEVGDDWENFSRVKNGQFEYSNAAFRHALGIGEEDEKTHLIAEAWNSVAKLELFLRQDLHKSK